MAWYMCTSHLQCSALIVHVCASIHDVDFLELLMNVKGGVMCE